MDLTLGIGVIVATLFGPVLAVWVTRSVDDRRAQRARQLDIFRTLMRSRRVPLSHERVQALNLVEIEFYGNRQVQVAYKSLMDHINTKPTEDARWIDEQSKRLVRLLAETGASGWLPRASMTCDRPPDASSTP